MARKTVRKAAKKNKCKNHMTRMSHLPRLKLRVLPHSFTWKTLFWPPRKIEHISDFVVISLFKYRLANNTLLIFDEKSDSSLTKGKTFFPFL